VSLSLSRRRRIAFLDLEVLEKLFGVVCLGFFGDFEVVLAFFEVFLLVEGVI
jgi:hypothetical protein